MSDDLNVDATSRSAMGKGASRRLRRDNLVPAILYGASEQPQPILLKSNEVAKHLENEGFYSQLLMLSVDGGERVRTILRDVQRHPFKQQILHLDFQRVVAGAELQVSVALHFIGESGCPGLKSEGGMVSHSTTELAVACRPRDIPEFLEVDMSQLHVGDSVHLSDISMPEGVRLVDLKEKGDDSDRAVASVILPRKAADEDIEAEADDDSTADDATEGDATAGDDD